MLPTTVKSSSYTQRAIADIKNLTFLTFNQCCCTQNVKSQAEQTSEYFYNKIFLHAAINVSSAYYHHHHHHRVSHFSALAGKYSPILGCSNQQD
jgi:imidazoleglycerol phosphate dehydratase HisB